MGDEYTPTTEEVRTNYAMDYIHAVKGATPEDYGRKVAEFDAVIQEAEARGAERERARVVDLLRSDAKSAREEGERGDALIASVMETYADEIARGESGGV